MFAKDRNENKRMLKGYLERKHTGKQIKCCKMFKTTKDGRTKNKRQSREKHQAKFRDVG